VIGDGTTDPDWIAMDLFSQAEHDEQAQSILVSPDGDYLDRVQQSMEKLLPTMERAEIIRRSLEDRGMLIKVASLSEAAEVSNRIAPEHLELSVADPDALLGRFVTRVPSSWDPTRRKLWVITARAPITCFPPAVPRVSHRPWVSMISRSAPP